MPKEPVDIADFARKVERLCDFILDKIPLKDGSEDIVIIQKLKADAADLQFTSNSRVTIEGLHTYINGG